MGVKFQSGDFPGKFLHLPAVKYISIDILRIITHRRNYRYHAISHFSFLM